MNQSDPVALLKEMIRIKEAEHRAEEILVREYFHETYESLKPINIIKSTISKAISSPDLKGNISNAVMGWITGFITKKLVVGNSDNMVTKLAGTVIEMVVASKVTQNADDIKAIAAIIMKKIMNQKQESELQNE